MPLFSQEMVDTLRYQGIQAYQNQLKLLTSRPKFKAKKNYIIAKLYAAIEEEPQTYLFAAAHLSESITTDFLIISKSARLIITIGMDEETLEISGNQLGKIIFQCNLEPKYKWRHLNVLYKEGLIDGGRSGCASCTLGLVGPNTNFPKWFNDVIATSWRITGPEDGFDQLLELFVVNIFLKRESGCPRKSKRRKKEDQTFWSGEELAMQSFEL